MMDLGLDRIIIPLAIVVGLAGGAMIGAELTQIKKPEQHFIR